jgi:hypothetical protein
MVLLFRASLFQPTVKDIYGSSELASTKRSMKMLDEITSEQIAQHFTAMGHSVSLINDIIAGDAMADDEIMVAKDFWTSEDMTAANAAIVAGKAYTA